jgi:hypothetical protein
VRRRPGSVAEEQSLHLRLRRVSSANLGDRRHDHACDALHGISALQLQNPTFWNSVETNRLRSSAKQ